MEMIPKQMKIKKILFVTFIIICDEFEFLGRCICVGSKRQKDETIIDNYFKHYFSNLDKGYIKAERYLYMGAQVGVKRISWNKITSEQKKILNLVGMY